MKNRKLEGKEIKAPSCRPNDEDGNTATCVTCGSYDANENSCLAGY